MTNHSVWFHLWSFDLSILVFTMSVAASTSANDKISLLIDIGVVRVEVLVVVIVEHTWLPVVFHHDLSESAHISWGQLSSLLVHVSIWRQSWMVINFLNFGLSLIFLCLEREVVNWLVSWLVTPVGSECLGPIFLVIFGTAKEMISPSNSSSQEVPVTITIDRSHTNSTPEDPSHLPDHPHVSLSHVVCYVEHHFAYN